MTKRVCPLSLSILHFYSLETFHLNGFKKSKLICISMLYRPFLSTAQCTPCPVSCGIWNRKFVWVSSNSLLPSSVKAACWVGFSFSLVAKDTILRAVPCSMSTSLTSFWSSSFSEIVGRLAGSRISEMAYFVSSGMTQSFWSGLFNELEMIVMVAFSASLFTAR